MTEDRTPADALAEIGRARAAVGARMLVHWGWDLAFALATGGIYAAYILPPEWAPMFMAPFVLTSAWLTTLRRNRTGIFLSQIVPPRARAIGLVLALVLGMLLLVVLLTSLLLNLRWPALASGVIATIATFIASRMWLRACQQDLAGEVG